MSTDESSGSGSHDSYFDSSDSQSQDSATIRQLEADARLRNEEEVSGGEALDLPPPLEEISNAHAPDFLKPEATKQVAKPLHRSSLSTQRKVQTDAQPAKKEWDIADMAPRLKQQTGGPNQNRGHVISAAAKRKEPEFDAHANVSAAQIAMLGGQAREPEEAASKRPKGPSKAMNVSDFLSKGEGGGLLPRNKQDRKEKEKEKRSRGQSSVHGWKSEAEMVLRQQYDS